MGGLPLMDCCTSVSNTASCIEVSLKRGVALYIYRLVESDVASRGVVDVLAEELVELRGIGAERGRTVSYPRTVCIGCTVCAQVCPFKAIETQEL